jgi:2-phosphoglycerate kinase
MTIVINFCSGPGSGKSTLAAELFVDLKKQGYVVEYLQEYAKKLTWEKEFDLLNNQHHVSYEYYKQIKAICNIGEIDYLILDSSLLNGLYYNAFNVDNMSNVEKTEKRILEYFNEFQNVVFFIERGAYKYEMHGRIQTEEEAVKIDCVVKDILKRCKIQFHVVCVRDNPISEIESVLGID